MSAQNPEPGIVEGPHDPEHDPAASYALEPDYVAALTRLVRSTSGETVPSISPINGQPLGGIPQSGEDDVVEAFERARKAQAAWSRT